MYFSAKKLSYRANAQYLICLHRLGVFKGQRHPKISIQSIYVYHNGYIYSLSIHWGLMFVGRQRLPDLWKRNFVGSKFYFVNKYLTNACIYFHEDVNS